MKATEIKQKIGLTSPKRGKKRAVRRARKGARADLTQQRKLLRIQSQMRADPCVHVDLGTVLRTSCAEGPVYPCDLHGQATFCTRPVRGVQGCITCKDYVTRAPVRPEAALRLRIGVTTSPIMRQGKIVGHRGTLPRTLQSILDAGWKREDVTIFAVPGSEVPDGWKVITPHRQFYPLYQMHRGIKHVHRKAKEQGETLDGQLWMEDDTIISRGTRAELDRRGGLPSNKCGILQLFRMATTGSSQTSSDEFCGPRRSDGYQRITRGKLLWGANAVIYSQAFIERLIRHVFTGGLSCSPDVAFGSLTAGWDLENWCCNPSLGWTDTSKPSSVGHGIPKHVRVRDPLAIGGPIASSMGSDTFVPKAHKAIPLLLGAKRNPSGTHPEPSRNVSSRERDLAIMRAETQSVTMVGPTESEARGWKVLENLARRFAAELGCTYSTRPDPGGVNVWFNYALWNMRGRPKSKRDIGLFTHRNDSSYERIADAMDWCIAMSNQSAQPLPEDKTTVIECPPDDRYRREPVIGICSSRDPRKRLKWIDTIRKAGFQVKSTEGNVPDDQMISWYDSITHLVVIGEREGGPLPFFEALAMCKPVIAPDVGVCPDYTCARYDGTLPDLLRALRGLRPPTWKESGTKMREVVHQKTGDRYRQLLKLINKHKPESIIEVGTYDGTRAIQMVQEAMRHRPRVSYRGYDLFEWATPETNERELNLRPPSNAKAVTRRLEKLREAYPGFTFKLLRGFTSDTLREPKKADFVFIDGGHSVQTIEHDLAMLKGSRLIVMDDWYEPDEQGGCPDISRFGCNQVIRDIPHEVLPIAGRVSTGGLVKMVLLK